jgi:hypothetical protein
VHTRASGNAVGRALPATGKARPLARPGATVMASLARDRERASAGDRNLAEGYRRLCVFVLRYLNKDRA